MKWDKEALKRLEKIPEFGREMAKKAVEAKVKEKGKERVILEDVEEILKESMSIMGAMRSSGKPKSATHIAIIRCERISEACPASACLLSWQARKVHFKDYGDDVKLVGFFTCGGCPGRRISRLLNNINKSIKVDVVHLSSCIARDEYGGGLPCPHRDAIAEVIKRKGLKVVQGTHH